MLYELKDTSRAEALFAGMEDTMILSCLQGMMGTVLVTDREHPRSALAAAPCFSFYAGEPERELAAWRPRGEVCMVPPDRRWAALIEECWPRAEKTTRYAIRKDTKFDRKRLTELAASLPAGYELRRIDGALYEQCRESGLFCDCVAHFGSRGGYLRQGRGFGVVKDGKLLSAASSFSVYRGGIEIEIDTVPEERRRGLAAAAGAALILSCLEDGLYPSWDAANPASVALAEKLGYELRGEYECYWLDGPGDGEAPADKLTRTGGTER